MKNISFILLLLLSSCLTTKTYEPFNIKDAQYYSQEGLGTIKGQLFSRTRSGDVKSGAGVEITLAPDTPYFRERYEVYKTCKKPQEPINPEAIHFLRTTKADLQGNFEFINLPPGYYLLKSTLSWYVTQYRKSGSYHIAEVDLKEGEEVKINFQQYCGR